MGFSSFLTSDTEESILNVYTGLSKTVYMLQPNGLEHIVEEAYQGYMTFGGVDIFEWIVKINKLDSLCKEKDIRTLGLALSLCGSIYIDLNTKQKYSLHYSSLLDDIQALTGSYDEIQDGYALTPNELIKTNIWEEISLIELLGIENLYLPRFSFNKSAVYENILDAQSCPIQGYFIEDADSYSN